MNNTNMYKMVGNFHDADILGMEFLTVNSYFDTINIVLKDRRFLLEYGSEIIKITLSDCSRVKTLTSPAAAPLMRYFHLTFMTAPPYVAPSAEGAFRQILRKLLQSVH